MQTLLDIDGIKPFPFAFPPSDLSPGLESLYAEYLKELPSLVSK